MTYIWEKSIADSFLCIYCKMLYYLNTFLALFTCIFIKD